MRKVIVVLSLILLTQLSVDAQSRKRPHRRQIDRTERLTLRAERMTDSMTAIYGLTDHQKQQLKELNTKWLNQNKLNRENNPRNKKQNRSYPCFMNDSICLGTPTLYKEVRLNKLENEVSAYRKELKKILTSKQYKEYEKMIQEGVSRALTK